LAGGEEDVVEPKMSAMTRGDSEGACFDADDLRRFSCTVFERLGMVNEDAAIIADHLIWADLRGLQWQGVQRLPQYVARAQEGGTNPRGELVLLTESPSFVVFDGSDMWGHVAGTHAMSAAMDKAVATGVGIAVVRNTTSAGALGYYGGLAAERGMIGLAINNSAPLLPAWGGTRRALGNQAFCVASPALRHEPLVLDMSTSAMSWVRIHESQRNGESLPVGVALTADGEPTVDPAAALEGMLLPMGGHRGYGLALMWEVLTGVLAGGERFAGNVSMPHDHARPQGVSMFLLAIDPRVAMPSQLFAERVDALIDQMHACPPATGAESVSVPGERSAATAANRLRTGIPLPPDVVGTLRALGAELAVEWPGAR
jgi:LDH2 family malate/lactate/ureidoglycolate dehydrogenase